MEITTNIYNDVITISLEGEIDLHNVPAITEAIDEHLKSKKKIIINLKKVGYIDSSGIGVLIASLSKIKKNGGQLKLLHVYDSVKKIFESTKLTSFFDIYDDEKKAIADFKKGPV